MTAHRARPSAQGAGVREPPGRHAGNASEVAPFLAGFPTPSEEHRGYFGPRPEGGPHPGGMPLPSRRSAPAGIAPLWRGHLFSTGPGSQPHGETGGASPERRARRQSANGDPRGGNETARGRFPGGFGRDFAALLRRILRRSLANKNSPETFWASGLLFSVVPLVGFEPTTPGLGNLCSIP